MIDPAMMTPKQKNDYIFAESESKDFPGGRFHWIDCLLGDIRTFLDGVEHFLQHEASLPDRGGGNLSMPILFGTALGLVSDLYAGNTEYMRLMSQCEKHDATKNVQRFVKKFFPDDYKKFPLIIWDGMRNGIVHLFSPKPLEFQKEIIRFTFFVESKTTQAWAYKKGDTTYININAFELYDVLKSAIGDYHNELEVNEDTKNKFILAWDSIEAYIRTIDPSDKDKLNEIETLVAEVKAANNYLVLWKDKGTDKDLAKGSINERQTDEILKGGLQEKARSSTANTYPLLPEK